MSKGLRYNYYRAQSLLWGFLKQQDVNMWQIFLAWEIQVWITSDVVWFVVFYFFFFLKTVVVFLVGCFCPLNSPGCSCQREVHSSVVLHYCVSAGWKFGARQPNCFCMFLMRSYQNWKLKYYGQIYEYLLLCKYISTMVVYWIHWVHEK